MKYALLVLAPALLFAQGPKSELLWPEGAPGAVGQEAVDKPSIDWYRPPSANGAAVLVCPGGGYGGLALDHEGKQIGEFFNSFGVTAVVLRYRLGPRYHHPAPLDDARKAMRSIRARAAEYGIDPKRIGGRPPGFDALYSLPGRRASRFFDSGLPRHQLHDHPYA
jgi:acetyl esterase/lipase